MLTNQVKVLIQRVRNGGRTPRAILVSSPLRDALRQENPRSMHYLIGSASDYFYGVPVKLVMGIPALTEPLIELEPLEDNDAAPIVAPEPGSLGIFAPKRKKNG